jgi:hypothetical protein
VNNTFHEMELEHNTHTKAQAPQNTKAGPGGGGQAWSMPSTLRRLSSRDCASTIWGGVSGRRVAVEMRTSERPQNVALFQ